MMRILVTGGAGFIGSHITDELISQGYDVVVVDDLSSGSVSNMNKHVKFEKGNICDFSFLEKVIKDYKCEYIFHLAAQTNVARSITDPILDANTNLVGSMNILNLSVKYNIKKIIFSSSAAVYGDCSILPITENTKKLPLSPYGLSKSVIEDYIELYNKLYSLGYVILRYSNVYGPRQADHGESGVVSVFVSNLLNDRHVIFFGDGSQTRDYIFVQDVAKVNVKCLTDNVNNGVYNVSTNKEVMLIELFNLINSSYFDNRFIPIYKEKRIGDIYRSCLDNQKISKVLTNFKFTPIKKGLNIYLENLIK